MAETNIIPFGKYKGRMIEELLVDDPAYLQWLTGQDWFRTKFVNLHQVIINRGGEPEETPEHNALQVLFLDDAFCLAFMRTVFSQFDAEVRKELDLHRDQAQVYYRRDQGEGGRGAMVDEPNSASTDDQL
jgi:uncharacterized protein (DUF3820 family)